MQRKASDKPKLELPQLFNFNLFGDGQKAVKPAEHVDKPAPKPAEVTKPATVPNGEEPPPAVVPPPPRKEGELRSILKQKAAEPPPVDELPAPATKSKTPPKDKPPVAPGGKEF